MANFNFNKIILGGRLTEDPELRTTPSGVQVTSFTIAVNRRFAKEGEQSADFFNVTAWRQTAEFITKFFRKASSICVVGTLETRTWTDNQGVKRYGVNIVADEAHFVDTKSEAPAAVQQAQGGYMPQGQGGYMPPPQYQSYQPAANAPSFEPLGDDDELPFP